VLRGATTDTLCAATFNNPSFGEAVSSATFTSGTWHHACGVWVGDSDRRVFLNGTKQTNATGVSTPTSQDFNIGRYGGTAPANYYDGDMAEVGLWSAALSDSEVASLAKGFPPSRIRPQSLAQYWPLYGASTEASLNGSVLTNNGTTKSAAHPRSYGR
jgi:hypothetical protein